DADARLIVHDGDVRLTVGDVGVGAGLEVDQEIFVGLGDTITDDGDGNRLLGLTGGEGHAAGGGRIVGPGDGGAVLCGIVDGDGLVGTGLGQAHHDRGVGGSDVAFDAGNIADAHCGKAIEQAAGFKVFQNCDTHDRSPL